MSLLIRRFLNSGGFIGYAKDVYELLTAKDLKDTDDDQRYYTKLFLEERDKRGIKLDTKTKIFANLNHAICKIHFKELSRILQGGPSGFTLPLFDIKTKVPSQYSLRILKRNSQFDVNKMYNLIRYFAFIPPFTANFELRFVDSEARLYNVDLETRPLIIHGNGPSKKHLNHLGNYLPKAWNEVDQCTSCWEDVIDFEV